MAKKKRKTPPQYKTGPKKGQFKPRGSSKKENAPKKRKSNKPMPKKNSPQKRRNNPGKSFQKEAMDLMLGGAVYGYVTGPEGGEGGLATINETLQKMPVIGNRDISNGLVLYFANKHLIKNKHVRNTAMAALVTGATKFGQSGFSLEGDGMGESEYDLSGLDDDDDAIDVTTEGEALSGVI